MLVFMVLDNLVKYGILLCILVILVIYDLCLSCYCLSVMNTCDVALCKLEVDMLCCSVLHELICSFENLKTSK